jgi:hypothetical protein
VRRRRRRNEWPDHSRLDRPAVDDHLEATDWSSW